MAKFELHYNQSTEYENKVEIDIRLQSRPSQIEYQDMLDAIETLNKIAKKYVVVVKTNEKETK